MTKLAHVEREHAIGLLKANVTPSVVAKRFRCHVRTIGRLKNHFQQIGTTSHRPRPGRRRVSTRRQDRYFSPTYRSRQAVPWAKRSEEFPYPIHVTCLSRPHDLLIPST